ncbi:MAG: hypothetical protein ACRC8Q_09850 [Aeromonas sp.]
MMNYFAWASGSEQPTFTGPTNPRTGKRSQVGVLSAFGTKAERDRFIEQTKGKAVPVTRPFAREMKAGFDDRSFNQLVALLVGGEE